jgi:hypothetical protein
MKKALPLIVLTAAIGLSACGKKHKDDEHKEAEHAAEQAAPVPVAAQPSAPAAEPTEQERERAAKQDKLDYATMEDQFINDPKAQWAATAKASSTFGETPDKAVPPEKSRVNKVVGPLDGEDWTNNSQDVGMDWLEAGYANPVNAVAVRVVCMNNHAIESINKIELIDEAGAAHTVWSGLSDGKQDTRGRRSWFVRTFEATPYKVKSVKVTFANNVSSGYKEVDAVQLVSP